MAETESTKRNPRIKDISGQRFGRLVAISFSHSTDKAQRWKCLCDCGEITIPTAGNLVYGHTKSCGCLQRELARARRTETGKSSTKEGKSWSNARLRCYSTNNKDFRHYGGRGIQMCAEWRESLANFLTDMGPCPRGFTLDRIDNDGNYEPGNCRWAPRADQANNQRRHILITHNGETHSLLEWSNKTGILYGRLYDRYRRGLDLFAAVKPHRPYRPRQKRI